MRSEELLRFLSLDPKMYVEVLVGTHGNGCLNHHNNKCIPGHSSCRMKCILVTSLHVYHRIYHRKSVLSWYTYGPSGLGDAIL